MRILAVVLLGAFAACDKEEPAGRELSASEEALLGTWEQVNDSGFESTVRLTFRADGTSGVYEIDGNSFRLDATKSTAVDEDGDDLEVSSEEPLNGTYVIEGDTLYVTSTEVDEDGKESQVTTEYHRV